MEGKSSVLSVCSCSFFGTVHGGLSQFSRRGKYRLWSAVFRHENGTVPFGR